MSKRIYINFGFDISGVVSSISSLGIDSNDEVIIIAGKNTYGGKVYHLSGSAILLKNGNDIVSIKVSKINSLTLKAFDGAGDDSGHK